MREDGCYKHLQGELGVNGQQPYPHAHWAGAFFTMSSMYYVYQYLFLSVQKNIIIYRFYFFSDLTLVLWLTICKK